MTRSVWLFAVAAFISSVADAAPGAIWQGVWQGHLGTQPVRVCLTKRGSWSFGAYYYLKHLIPISLRQLDETKEWAEGNGDPKDSSKPHWLFETISDTRLTASWSADGKSLPITLARVSTPADDEMPCGSAAFNAARNTGGHIVAKPAKLDGQAYTKLAFVPGRQFSDVNIESFALNEKSPAISRVNAVLREKLPAATGTPDYLDCLTSSLGSLGSDGEYSLSLSPALITPHWLAVAANEGGFCGGAHPYYDEYSRTFDLRTGKEVDLHDWFGPAGFAAGKDNAGQIAPALRALVLKHGSKPEAECEDELATTDYWGVGLTRKGMTFIPSLPHVALACSETMLVPYAQISRFLNAKGKTAMALILSDLK